MDLARQTALVTGANRGLGAAFVTALAARGAKVYAAARRSETLAPAPGVTPLALDVTEPAHVARAAETAGDVTLLVNNAGVLWQRSLAEQGDLAALEAEMAVNVFGLARMSLAFAPVIAGQGGGAIVNMLSVASLVPFPAFGSYAASKAAAMSLTHSLRWDLAPRGVAVHGVYAGFIATDMVGNLAEEKADPDEIVTRALDGVAEGRLDIPTDARSERFLAELLSEEVLAASRARADAFRAAYPLAQTEPGT